MKKIKFIFRILILLIKGKLFKVSERFVKISLARKTRIIINHLFLSNENLK